MMKKEWKFIFEHKFLLVVLGAIALIPALYNLIFLGALWDPYGNVDHLPVAVVNNDLSVEFEGQTLAIGDELVDNLKESKSLDYHFVSESEANEGLLEGDYYLTITIPEKFSENATTLLTDKPEKMVIDYQTTEGRNLTASKMAASAITELKSEVSNQVTGMYTETILEQFGNVGSGMEEAAEGSQKLEDGTAQLTDASELIQKNLETLASSSLEFAEGSQTLSVGLEEYIAGVSQVDSGADQLTTGLSTLSSNIPTLATGINQLDNGASSLAAGLQQYTSGVNDLSSATSQLNSGVTNLSGQLPVLTKGISSLANGADDLTTGLQQYTVGVSSVNEGVSQLDSGLTQLVEQTKTLPTQTQQLNDGAAQLAKSLQAANLSADQKEQLVNYVSEVQAYIEQVSGVLANTELRGLGNTDQMTSTMADDLSNVQSTVAELNTELAVVKESIQTSYQADLATNADAVAAALEDSGVTLTEEQKAAILTAMQHQESQTVATANSLTVDMTAVTDAVAQSKSNVAALSNELDSLENVDQLSSLQSKTDQLASVTETKTVELATAVNSLYGIAQVARPTAQGIADATTQLNNALPVLAASLQELQAGSQSILSGTSTLVGKSDALNSGASQVSDGLTTVNGKSAELVSGVEQLADGTTKVSKGANQLDENSSELNNGANSLSTGLTTVAGKVPALSNGITALLTGSETLSDGTKQLVANSGKLIDGSEKLTDGALQISSGSGQLADGEAKVTGSLKQVDTGLLTLMDSLSTGASQIQAVNTSKDSAEAVTDPVITNHTDKDEVANNGTSMAPYMMSVALFVGALTTNMMFDAFKPKEQPTSGIAWWASKMSILGIVSVLQAVIVFFVLTSLLGMDPIYPGKVLGFLVLESLTFMSIVTLFNVVFGKVGAFLMLIFMILQLASSGGTYPIALSSSFYQNIYPYLPMTYAIDALRNAISIGGPIGTDSWLFVILLVLSNILMIVFFGIKKKSYQFDGEEAGELV
ncbi:YhgE/Pip domain-containing protein [Desemzia sp. RIT804]|uniref:YhgE/Pip domain-containing protein n=1 Tax=Desemzia sp. RIT 804 TaxID=2810209 RepID=UPI00194F0644|nr:YhgE/Pip domain-containing protein [Desemzia sp. RIT 804]MBM6614899.1 YhgE/Pip domain-containing protein [Desemzia sp. RIT 804]